MTRFNILAGIIISTLLLVFSSTPAAADSVVKRTPQKPLTGSIKIYPPQLNGSGGPDQFGYIWIDSDENGGPAFNWVDITSRGTRLSLSDDDNQGPFSLPFTFNFYGADFNSFRVCSNGFVSFTSSLTSYSNSSIPSNSAPENLLALFWDDLNPGTGGDVYYYTNSDSAVISYIGVPHYYNEGSYTMQIIILASGEVIYQYDVMEGELNSATIGIQDGEGSVGLQVAYNQAYMHDNLAILFDGESDFDYDIEVVSIDSPPSAMRIGQIYTPMATFKNVGTEAVQAFDVIYGVVYDQNVVYSNIQNIAGLVRNQSIQVSFDEFIPQQSGRYTLGAISLYSGDENPDNDSLFVPSRAFSYSFNEDFEDSNGAFTNDNDWEWGHPTAGPGNAHSGQNAWGTILDGNYNNTTVSALISPLFDIGVDAMVGFYHWYETETGNDGGNVKISTDFGNTWELIAPVGGYPDTSRPGNPLYPEPVFTGHGHTQWDPVFFDIDQYGGYSVQFKFEFATNGYTNAAGWYIDDFAVYGLGGTGLIAGIVSDSATHLPIEGAVVRARNFFDTTNANGIYIMEVPAATMDITATAQYYNPMTIYDVEVLEEETTYVNIALLHPEIDVDDSPIEVFVYPGDSATYTLPIGNIGNGPLDFTVRAELAPPASGSNSDGGVNKAVEIELEPPSSAANTAGGVSDAAADAGGSGFPVVDDFGDEIFTFDPQEPTGDNGCLGIEFDGIYFWVTGRDPDHGNIHKLHKFDSLGTYVSSFNQGSVSTWGWRDLAWDGEYLYASDEFELAVIDTSTGTKIDELPMPPGYGGGAAPCRGLAYDPATDHFWTANWNSPLTEFDREGNAVNTYDNDLMIYGLAWDDTSFGGPFLWVFSQDGGNPYIRVSQFDPVNGEYTGVMFNALGFSGDLAGGAGFSAAWDPELAILFVLIQSEPNDRVAGYEIGRNWSWLRYEPDGGTIPAGGSEDLILRFDATDPIVVPDTIYNGVMVINNNSFIPEVRIPVSMNTSTVGVEDDDSGLPFEFDLAQNYPNPFNPVTVIEYALPENGSVRLEVFNLCGQKVKTLVDDYQQAGYKEVIWDGTDKDGRSVASGIYFCRLKAGDHCRVRKMSLIK
jgi:hypothetical protein